MRFNEAGQRLAQSPRAAFRRRPAPPLPSRAERIGQPPRCCRFGRLRRLVSHPHHERAAVLVLKILANNFPRGHRQPPLPDLSLRVFGKPLVQWFPETDRGIGRGRKERLHLLVFRHHPALSLGILLRKLSELLPRPVLVRPFRTLPSTG